MKLDDALFMLGAHGRYQICVYLLISLFDNFPSIWHMSVMAFLGYEPDHHCKIPDGATYNRSIPVKLKDGVLVVDKCNIYPYVNGTYSNHTEPCGSRGWWYSKEHVRSTVVTEWDLVCHRNVLPEASQMVFNFGVMFGAVAFGFFSDKFGRKKSFIFALVSQSVVGTAAALAPNFYLFVILRFFVGALEQGVNITGFIMATELFPPKQRTIFGVTHEFFWAVGGAFLPLFGYFLRDWRHLQLAVSVPGVLGFMLWWMVPESVVWLIAKGRYKEAEEILRRVARWNRKSLPANCLSDEASKPMVDQADKTPDVSGKTYTVIDLFRTKAMRKITICVCGTWAINTMVYYGLSYNTPNLDGDMYFNFFVGQMVEIPSVAFTMLLMYRVGRRWPLCLFHVIGGLVCIVSPFVPPKTGGGADLKWLSVTLAMLGKFFINGSFTIIYVYGPEIYPTVVRNTGAGLASSSGRIGGIMYPYINYLSKLNIGPMSKKLPLIVFGSLAVAGGFLALPLPETRHRPLPQTIEDVEHYEEFCSREKNKKDVQLADIDGTNSIQPQI